MAGIACCTIVGNLGKEIEVKETKNGRPYYRGSIGVSPKKDGATLWFNFQVWGKAGETLASYTSKGSRLLLSGTLDPYEYEAKGGGTRTAFTLNVQNFTFLSSPKEGKAAKGPEEEFGDDDVPF